MASHFPLGEAKVQIDIFLITFRFFMFSVLLYIFSVSFYSLFVLNIVVFHLAH